MVLVRPLLLKPQQTCPHLSPLTFALFSFDPPTLGLFYTVLQENLGCPTPPS